MNNFKLQYTKHANIIIKKYLEDKSSTKLIYAEEFISHDGYDKHGPKSDLLDLYIIIKENEVYKVLNYYCENWFDGNEFCGYMGEPSIYDLKLLYNSSKNTNLILTIKPIIDDLIKKGLINI